MTNEADLKQEYLRYLIFLYTLEFEDGINVGDYPTYKQFLKIRSEERCHSRAEH